MGSSFLEGSAVLRVFDKAGEPQWPAEDSPVFLPWRPAGPSAWLGEAGGGRGLRENGVMDFRAASGPASHLC